MIFKYSLMKFRLIITLTLLIMHQLLIAQGTEPCFFDNYQRTNSETIARSEAKIREFLIQKKLSDTLIKIIPVVVHVIHDEGIENISDAQIFSQIDALNEDFRKILNTNGDGNGADTKIEFHLAQLTPEGKCTNGIVRIRSSLTNHQTHQRSMLKDLSYWDNLRYFNIYVVKSINGGSGILGYASFPGGPSDEDGIVVRHNYFGRTGTAASSLGRTTTHEAGHWLGLYHTFNNGCGLDLCADGDYICDTPPAANPNFYCPTINSCSNDVPDIDDQVENYMDYSNEVCKNIFTVGQKERMDASLHVFRWDIWQNENLVSTGTDSTHISSPCNAVADFTSNSQSVCVGNPVLFINKSLNNCNSYQWFFPGGTPNTSNQQNQVVTYNTEGVYSASLHATNDFGTDSISFVNYIHVVSPSLGQVLPFEEGFESDIFPENGINIDNPDGGVTWERDTIAVAFSGNASVKINNLVNTNYGQADALVLPNFDLTSFSGIPYIKFKWAYAKSDPNYSDELLVLISTDCGVNFSQVFYRSGTSLTTGPTQITPYIPDSTTQWKSASISLNNYKTSTNAIIKIVNVTDGGNNLYLDNISLGDIATEIWENEPLETFNLFPNPATSSATIEYQLNHSKKTLISIYDMMGNLIQVLEESIKTEGTHRVIINRNELSPGVYFIKSDFGDKQFIRKIIFM
jgi:PKD repeat protein